MLIRSLQNWSAKNSLTYQEDKNHSQIFSRYLSFEDSTWNKRSKSIEGYRTRAATRDQSGQRYDIFGRAIFSGKSYEGRHQVASTFLTAIFWRMNTTNVQQVMLLWYYHTNAHYHTIVTIGPAKDTLILALSPYNSKTSLVIPMFYYQIVIITIRCYFM